MMYNSYWWVELGSKRMIYDYMKKDLKAVTFKDRGFEEEGYIFLFLYMLPFFLFLTIILMLTVGTDKIVCNYFMLSF